MSNKLKNNKVVEAKFNEAEEVKEEVVENVEETKETTEPKVEEEKESKLAKVWNFTKKKVLPGLGIAGLAVLSYTLGKNSSSNTTYGLDSYGSDDDDYMKYLETQSAELDEAKVVDATDYTVTDIEEE